MKLKRTHKIIIASGVTLLAGSLLFAAKAKANSGGANTLPGYQPSNNKNALIVTHYDTIYDYKYEAGLWYSRRKGTQNWVNLKTALTPQKYALVESRLKKYISG